MIVQCCDYALIIVIIIYQTVPQTQILALSIGNDFAEARNQAFR
jgi:hypothetical protein